MAAVCAWLALAAVAGAQERPDPPGEAAPPVERILKEAIARAKWNDERGAETQFAFRRESHREDLDSDGRVKKREQARYEVDVLDGAHYYRIVERDGQPLSAKELEKERKKEQQFRKRLAEERRKKAQRRAKGKKEKDDDEVSFDKELIARYHFQLLGSEPVNGRAAWLLSFEPRGPDLPQENLADRLLNNVAGRMWIDAANYEIARIDLNLWEHHGKIRFAWLGLLGSLSKFALRFERVQVDETAWMPSYVEAYIDGRVLVKSVHMKLRQQNHSFQRVSGHTAQKTSQ